MEETNLQTSTQYVVYPPTSNTSFEESKNNIVKEVISTIEEEMCMAEISQTIRVGGLHEDWRKADVIIEEEIEADTYVPDSRV